MYATLPKHLPEELSQWHQVATPNTQRWFRVLIKGMALLRATDSLMLSVLLSDTRYYVYTSVGYWSGGTRPILVEVLEFWGN